MREWIEARVWGDELLRRLPPDLGKNLDTPEERERFGTDPGYAGGTRLIILPADSPRWGELRPLLEQYPNAFGAWVKRKYTPEELAGAELLRLIVTRAFEPAGEECGTTYDDSKACPICGAGRVQTSDLHLRLRRGYQRWPSIPQARRTAIARTIADEVIVSTDLADVITSEKITGCELRPVWGCGPRAKMASYWKQLWVIGRAGRTVAPTAFGDDILIPERRKLKGEPETDMERLAFDGRWYPTDQTGQYRCPRGHVSGLNVLSEAYIDRAGWDGSDISATEDLVGARRGLLVPSPLLLITQRFYRLLPERSFKGLKVEIAHFVG